MGIRAKLTEIQKSRKRRLPINDSSESDEVQLPETNLEEDDENVETNLIKFEQGVTNKGNVAPNMSLSAIVEVPRWEMPLVRTPQYPIAFWNVNERALKALAKTNNALESSHYQFIKKLNHHPSMSDFLLAILNDVDKQVDIARSAATFKHQRKEKYIVKEAQVFTTLNEAEYDDDWQILNVLTLLGLQMSGYIDGLRSTERQPEERETEDGVDSEDLENDHPSTSSSLFI